MGEKAHLCLLFGTQGAGDPHLRQRACLQNPFPAPMGSQVPPTLGQLPALITALPGSKTSHGRLE